MSHEVTERLWRLYCRHAEQLAEDARLVRTTLQMVGSDVVRTYPLTRQEFAQCLRSTGLDPVIQRRWLGRILQCAESADERAAFEGLLGLTDAEVFPREPHFARLGNAAVPADKHERPPTASR